MHLNHLNLSFASVQAASLFFQKHFGFRLIGEHNNDAISVLTDESGFVLVVSNFEKQTEHHYPGAFHIGFILDTVEDVWKVYRQMIDDGVDLKSLPRKTPRGTTFYGHIEDTVMFEVLSRPE